MRTIVAAVPAGLWRRSSSRRGFDSARRMSESPKPVWNWTGRRRSAARSRTVLVTRSRSGFAVRRTAPVPRAAQRSLCLLHADGGIDREAGPVSDDRLEAHRSARRRLLHELAHGADDLGGPGAGADEIVDERVDAGEPPDRPAGEIAVGVDRAAVGAGDAFVEEHAGDAGLVEQPPDPCPPAGGRRRVTRRCHLFGSRLPRQPEEGAEGRREQLLEQAPRAETPPALPGIPI